MGEAIPVLQVVWSRNVSMKVFRPFCWRNGLRRRRAGLRGTNAKKSIPLAIPAAILGCRSIIISSGKRDRRGICEGMRDGAG